VISYKPRLQKEAWLVLPSKGTKEEIKIKDLKDNVASKSVSFCEDTASH
jgi:hypothetical protein